MIIHAQEPPIRKIHSILSANGDSRLNEHAFEDLGDELFQMLCQALLVREFADVQCFPVGMPDGGRDATSGEHTNKDAIVFQVKFSRNPAKIKDTFNWVTAAIDGEVAKVERLAARGVQRFILITNAPGTSHLDKGTMDRVQAYLDEKLPIPGKCWWRDDLDRRLDSSFDLKMRYPAVLKGSDIARLMLEKATKGEGEFRRQQALNAYLSFHSREDSRVRFKQVELVSTLLQDLFIDVPATIGKVAKRSRARAEAAYGGVSRRLLQTHEGRSRAGEEEFGIAHSSDGEYYRVLSDGRLERFVIGGGDLLTDPQFTAEFPCVVIEGAPGQGKSTLTQYLAQIQRSRMLQRSQEIRRYPKVHQQAPVAMPFRIELRDLAIWLKGFNPWVSDNQTPVKHNKPQSLEGALAAHVEHFSGGLSYDVSDLYFLLREVPTILLLDALDEVPDIEDRNAVIDAVQNTLSRFEGNDVQPQVIVTSRPTAIAGSPNFPTDSFLHLSLAPLDDDSALTYATKWAKARRLSAEEARRLPITLREKMRAQHIEQLARNTMQLSILLSLVNRRGSSLPDKRTELYNAYFEIFLDRESDKSTVVRDNRDLLFDIHRFLGFHLHSIAEQQKSSGRIGHSRLKSLLFEYLTHEKQPYDLIDSLLTGMVERFGALVSRVQGQYEFEVQPLQEYFAARHLNDTAPFSLPGEEHSGTKPDRFDGVAPNPYWFNVTRFFAGCFNKGELAELADRICDLVSSPEQHGKPYARSLAVALLQDWVFSQRPRAMERVARAVFDDLGLALAVTGFLDSSRGGPEAVALPPGGGAEMLVDICWERLVQAPRITDRVRGLCRLIARNSLVSQYADRWHNELLQRSGDARRIWLTIGSYLNVTAGLNAEKLAELIDEGSEEGASHAANIFRSQLRARQRPEEEIPIAMFKNWLSYPLIGNRPYLPHRATPALMSAWATNPKTWLNAIRAQSMEIDFSSLSQAAIEQSKTNSDSIYFKISQQFPKWFGENTSTSLESWIAVTSLLDDEFGPTLTGIEIAVMSAAIRNASERGKGGERMFDTSVALPIRMRYARGRRSDQSWWISQASESESELDAALWCMAAATWMNSDTFLEVIDKFDDMVCRISPTHQDAIMRSIRRGRTYGTRNPKSVSVKAISANISELSLVAASVRCHDGELVGERIKEGPQTKHGATAVLTWTLTSDAERVPVQKLAEAIRLAHRAGGEVHLSELRGPLSRRRSLGRLLLEDPWDVPTGYVVSATRAVLSDKAVSSPVLALAEADGWFEDN